MEQWLLAIVGGAAAILLARWITKRRKKGEPKESTVYQSDVKVGDGNRGIAIGKDIKQNINKDSSGSASQKQL